MKKFLLELSCLKDTGNKVPLVEDGNDCRMLLGWHPRASKCHTICQGENELPYNQKSVEFYGYFHFTIISARSNWLEIIYN